VILSRFLVVGGDDLRSIINEMRAELAGVKDSVSAELAGVKDSVSAELAGVKDSVSAELAGVKDSVSAEFVPIRKALILTLQSLLDPWEKIAKSSTSGSSKSSLVEYDRKDICEYYGIPESHYCMVIGLCYHCDVSCAHIWPKHTYGDGIEQFELKREEINSPRNFLRLHKAIEKAFDSKHLIFLPSSDGGSNTFVVRVLNRNILLNEFPVDKCKSMKFEDIDGQKMHCDFRGEKYPFRRLLAYHASKALDVAERNNWIESSETISQARLESFLLASKSLEERSFVMEMFHTRQEKL
jgi:hypothetical protein